MPWIDIKKNIKNQIITFVLEAEIQSQNGEIHLWTIKNKKNSELIGLIGVDKMTHQGGDLNFGYWVKHSFQQKKIATNAIPKVILWLSKFHNSKNLEITVNPENIAGIATCKHIINKLNLDCDKYKKTILNHNKNDLVYHTYIIPLKNIFWK